MPGKMRVSRTTPQRLSNEAFFPQQSSSICFYHQHIYEPVQVHWHEFHEVSLILAGSGTHLLNGTEQPLRTGTLFLLTPTDFHAVIPQPDQPLELFNVIFKEEIFDSAFLDMLFATPGNMVMDAKEAVMPTLEYEFRRLWQESEQQQVGFQQVMRGTLERILIDLRRGCSTPSASSMLLGEEPLPASLRPTLIYLQHHFREPLTLTGVARHAGFSSHYFSEYFHKAAGVTFQHYVQDLRLRFAHSLLAVSRIPVTTICTSSGFNSLAHFERVFKQRFGMSPRVFQQCCAEKSKGRRPQGTTPTIQ